MTTDNTPGRTCSSCGEWKPRSEFTVRRQSRDGMNPACRECYNAERREARRKARPRIYCHGCGSEITEGYVRKYCSTGRGKSAVIGECDECGGPRTSRGVRGRCNTCDTRSRRKAAIESGERVRCEATWVDDDGGTQLCDHDAYFRSTLCHKHRSDMRRFGEFRGFKWRTKDRDPLLISSKTISELRAKLLEDQGGVCAMPHCGTDDPDHQWQLDHDHSCPFHAKKKMCERCIRGVLCRTCNQQLLGTIESADVEPLTVLMSVLSYLEAS